MLKISLATCGTIRVHTFLFIPQYTVIVDIMKNDVSLILRDKFIKIYCERYTNCKISNYYYYYSILSYIIVLITIFLYPNRLLNFKNKSYVINGLIWFI